MTGNPESNKVDTATISRPFNQESEVGNKPIGTACGALCLVLNSQVLMEIWPNFYLLDA